MKLAQEPIKQMSTVHRGSFDNTFWTKAGGHSSSSSAERFPSQRAVHRVGSGNHGICTDENQPRLSSCSRACHLRQTLRLSLRKKTDQHAVSSTKTRQSFVTPRSTMMSGRELLDSDFSISTTVSTTRAETHLRARTWLIELWVCFSPMAMMDRTRRGMFKFAVMT